VESAVIARCVLVLLLIATFAAGQIYPRHPDIYDAEPEPAIADERAFFALLDRNHPQLRDTLAAAEAHDWVQAKQAWREHLRSRASPRWLYARDQRDAMLGSLQKRFNAHDKLSAEARQALDRRLTLGGREVVLPAGQMPWLGALPDGSTLHPQSRQILNHLHHWLALGRAIWADKNAEAARDLASQIVSWRELNPMVAKAWLVSKDRPDNPLKFHLFAPDWHHHRSLCVGIRAPNLAELLELVIDSPDVPDEAIYQLTRIMAEHARYLTLLTRVEGFRGGNWQMIETTGLVQLAIMLPEFTESKKWLDTGMDMLAQNMHRDIRDDGWQSELTPMYHGWVLAQYTQTLLLARRNGIEPTWDMQRFERMYDVYVGMAAPDGTMPGIGDARTGNVRTAAATGALLFNRPDLRFLGPERLEERHHWLFGPAAVNRYSAIVPRPPTAGSVLFRDAKYAVLRSGWNRDRDLWALLDISRYAGGHSHADALQVLLHAGTRSLLIDPGVCDYSDPRSVALRTSAYHNVVLLGHDEISARAEPTLLAFETSPVVDLAAGELLHESGVHRRVVLVVRPDPTSDSPTWHAFGYVVILDLIDTAEHCDVRRRFGFPGVELEQSSHSVRTQFEQGINLDLQFSANEESAVSMQQIPTGPLSFVDRPMVERRSGGTGRRVLWAVATPFDEPGGLPVVDAEAGTPWSMRIRIADQQSDQISLDVNDSMMVLSISREGRVAARRTFELPLKHR
jgi:hypothetical protein